MIKCNGTLRIKKIRQSRNGAFCIADLSTDFGEFKVKDPLLDQFEEGEYQGTLWISEDSGDHWATAAPNLPPIHFTRFV